jgi:hypothetical protein
MDVAKRKEAPQLRSLRVRVCGLAALRLSRPCQNLSMRERGCHRCSRLGGRSRMRSALGIQALERIAPGLPLVPGKVERREFQYKRHGTQTLIAAFNITTGGVEGVVGNTRTEKDFTRFLRHLLSSAAPTTKWDIVCDNLNIHLSESVVRLVARVSGLKPRPAASHHLPLHAQTRIMAKPNRDLVFHPRANASSPRQFRQQKRLAYEDRAVHRLFQRDHGQALPLDHGSKTSHRLGQNESLIFAQLY